MCPQVPAYKNYRGTIARLDQSRFVCSGELAVLDDTTLEITELPIKTWTQVYKESVLEPLLGGEKQPQVITDFKVGVCETVRTVASMRRSTTRTQPSSFS
jgi:DNA topoisomerase-2